MQLLVILLDFLKRIIKTKVSCCFSFSFCSLTWTVPFLNVPQEPFAPAISCSSVLKGAAFTHSVGSHAGVSGLVGLAGGGWMGGPLVLGISALAGGGLGGLGHGEGLQESLGQRQRSEQGKGVG